VAEQRSVIDFFNVYSEGVNFQSKINFPIAAEAGNVMGYSLESLPRKLTNLTDKLKLLFFVKFL
jgi:hypothetical protein